MVREAKREELMEILELYLHLHETSIPEQDDHLEKVWDQIMSDENHHIIVNEVDGRIVSTKMRVITEAIRRPLFSGWANL